MLDKMLLRPTIFCSCHMNVFNLPRITFFRNSDAYYIKRSQEEQEQLLVRYTNPFLCHGNQMEYLCLLMIWCGIEYI